MLTRKQYDLLQFIHKRLQKDGVPPSFDEMKEALRLKSKSGIHRLITGLEERGFLRRLPHRARALQVVKLPDSAALPAPNVTPLLADARALGLRTVDGLGMLLHQAVPGFEAWFGVRPEVTPELRAKIEATL